MIKTWKSSRKKNPMHKTMCLKVYICIHVYEFAQQTMLYWWLISLLPHFSLLHWVCTTHTEIIRFCICRIPFFSYFYANVTRTITACFVVVFFCEPNWTKFLSEKKNRHCKCFKYIIQVFCKKKKMSEKQKGANYM